MVEKNLDNNARRLARLAAVQGLYQLALTDVDAAEIIKRFRADPCVLLQEEQTVIAVDTELFARIVAGVTENTADLDAMLAGALDARLSVERLEPLLKAILRAGVFELHHSPDVNAGIIINDYVDVAHSFFDAKEPGLVNAILDRLGKTLRE